MRYHHPVLISAVLAAGLFCGALGNRLTRSRWADTTAVAPMVARKPEPASTISAPGPARLPRSSDTAEALLALDGPDLYERLARWLVDVDEPAVSSFWREYRRREHRDYRITQLLFVRWTMIDPQAAVAASDPEDSFHAWQAWACNDPERALAAAIADGRDFARSAVIGALAEFHFGWLLAHFESLPDEFRESALSRLRDHINASAPATAMEFALRHGDDRLMAAAFRSLAAEDLVAAWDWLQQNPAFARNYLGGSADAIEFLLQQAAPGQGKELQMLAAMTPPGATRRMLEAKRFEQLVAADPETALAVAKGEKVPSVAASRLAVVGMSFAHSQPEKAFEAAETLVAVMPGTMEQPIKAIYPEGEQVCADSCPETFRLFGSLMTKDPARTLETALQGIGDPAESGIFRHLASTWSNNDPESFAHWVNQQADPLVRAPAARTLINKLRRIEHYGEALEWALTVPGSNVGSIYQDWKNAYPGQAEDWLNATDLPPDRKELLMEGGDP